VADAMTKGTDQVSTFVLGAGRMCECDFAVMDNIERAIGMSLFVPVNLIQMEIVGQWKLENLVEGCGEFGEVLDACSRIHHSCHRLALL
jgi:hypothetical protein